MTDVTDRSAEADRKIIHDINTHGWHVMKIMPSGEDPGWAFSIGLYQTFGHPEIVIFGLDPEAMHSIINLAGGKIRGGASFADGAESEDLLNQYPCVFRTLDRFWYPHVLGFATWFYGGEEFPAVQLLWPDKQRRYPWDAGFEPGLVSQEPLLFHRDPRKAHAEALLASLGGEA